MEPRTIPGRARIGLAAARPRDRNAAAADTGRAAQGHSGSRDDPGRSGTLERHLRYHRSSLPIAAGDSKHDQGSTFVTAVSITINGRAYGPIDVRDDLTMNDFLR